jgi:hypothetical protein
MPSLLPNCSWSGYGFCGVVMAALYGLFDSVRNEAIVNFFIREGRCELLLPGKRDWGWNEAIVNVFVPEWRWELLYPGSHGWN